MPEIPQPHRYEPDNNALKLWLATRKQDKAYGQEDITGFFSTNDFPKDKVFFFAALFFETVGVIMLIGCGIMLGDPSFTVVAIVVAVILLFVDLILAYFLHRNQKDKCLARNILRVSEDPAARARIGDDLKKGKVGDFFIVLTMILIAFFKFSAIALLGTFDHIAIFIALAIMFTLIVYIHVKHTGYYMYAAMTNRAFKKQLDKLNRGDVTFAVGDWVHYFETDVDLLEGKKEIVANQSHKIVAAEKRDTQKLKHAYDIRSKGILTDRDITSFLRKQSITIDQIMVITSESIKFQLRQYNSKI